MKDAGSFKKIEDFFSVTSSKRVFQSEWKSEGVPFYRAREIVKLAQDGYVNNDLYISNEMYNDYKSKYGVPQVGDILITGVGTLGTCYLIENEKPFYFKDGNVIWLKKKEEINSKYVLYAYLTDDVKKQVHEHAGAVVGTYTIDKAKNTSFFVPPLPEQERIVKKLDAAFEKIDQLKKNAENGLQAVKDLWQSALREELKPKDGWVKKTLADVCSLYGEYGMSVPSKEFDGIRYLRITDIKDNGDLNDELVSADIDTVDDSYILKEGDILFARTGATVGKTLLYKDEFGKCSFAGYLIRYRPNQEIVNPKFIFLITHSNKYYKWILENQKAAAQPNISAKLYNAYQIFYPALPEQNKIVKRLDGIFSICQSLQTNYEQELAEYETLKQSILRKAFSGKL